MMNLCDFGKILLVSLYMFHYTLINEINLERNIV